MGPYTCIIGLFIHTSASQFFNLEPDQFMKKIIELHQGSPRIQFNERMLY